MPSPEPNRPAALVLLDVVGGLVYGRPYVKSKGVAQRTNLSPKQVGRILGQLESAGGPVVVEQHNASGEAWTVDVELEEA